MEPSKDSLGQKPAKRMNPWLFWCPLLGGIAMMPLLVFLLFSHRGTAAVFFHFASTAAITFSLIYCLNRYQKSGEVGRIIALIFSTFFLFGVLYVMIMASFVAPFGGYNESHFGKQLKADLRSAYTHANAYLSEHPQERINQEEQLRAMGWKPSPEVSFESANLTTKGGMIVLKHKQLKNFTRGLKPGEGRVSTDGKDINVEVPAPY